jgi:histidyl-tRNA synthetase
MIGRFLGREVPAVGFSIGFERIMDLLPGANVEGGAVALLHDADVPAPVLLAAKAEARASAPRVRLERARRNRKGQLDSLAAEGFTAFATVTADGLGELRPLS